MNPNEFEKARIAKKMVNPILKNQKIHYSPSQQYELIITPFEMEEKHWNFTEGLLFKKGNNKPFAQICRNHSSFPFSWIEPHKNGHSYLICGEDYQGQTVIELDTEKRANNPPGYFGGFCWATHYPSPDGQLMAVEGCFWASPYEVKIFDFSTPMSPPWKELLNDSDCIDFLGWNGNSCAKIGRAYDFSKIHNRRYSELTEEEQDELEEKRSSGIPIKDLYELRQDEIIWNKPE